MASFDDPNDPLALPPRPTTPPVRRGFLMVLAGLMLAAALVYGIPAVAFRTGQAYEAGRAESAKAMLKELDEAGVINKASALFRAASTAVAPAVVNIQCLRDVQFAPEGEAGPPGRPRSGLLPVSAGSGVVIDKQRGYIVTNGHVVEGADEIIVRIGRSTEYSAQLVGADSKTDLAVLKVNAPLQVEARWADPRRLDIGDWVLAIGSPYQLEQTVTVGIISAIGRRNLPVLDEGGYQDFIQTDAAINPGNSGGPLIDLRGEIVGINTAIFSPGMGPQTEGSGGNVGIGFAISAELARNVVDQIIKNGRVVRSYLGVILGDVSQAAARDLKLPEARGALIVEVDPESPADRAGLRPGDVVVGLGEQAIDDMSALRTRAATLPAGSEVVLTYFREGREDKLTVRVAELPTLRALGLRLRELDLEENGGEPVLVIEHVLPGSPAACAGLRPGLRLIAIANRPATTRAEADAIADRLNPGDPLPLLVQAADGAVQQLVIGVPPRGR